MTPPPPPPANKECDATYCEKDGVGGGMGGRRGQVSLLFFCKRAEQE